MMDIPAFPCPEQRGADGCGIREAADGMSLRDWFATHAPEPPTTWWDGEATKTCDGYALWNYQYADAMLDRKSDL